MEEIIKKIKSKKPLDKLDDEFVKGFINNFFKTNFKLNKKYLEGKLKKKDLEIIIKNVRNELNKSYAQFWTGNKLDLKSHKSTKERLEIYQRVYDHIFSITGEPKIVLDLGCGLNPLTYSYIGKNVYFVCVELTDYDCDKLREYFKQNGIKGEVVKADLRTFNNFSRVDICFMFKILESLENKGHLLAEHLIKSVKADYIIVSFSTVDIKGRKMNYPRRGWFEIMIKRLGFDFEIYEDYNEIFYIVKK